MKDKIKKFIQNNPYATDQEIETFYVNEVMPDDKRSIAEILDYQQHYYITYLEYYDKLETSDLIGILWESHETDYLKKVLHYKESVENFSDGHFLFIPNDDVIKFRDGFSRLDLILKISIIGWCDVCEFQDCECERDLESQLMHTYNEEMTQA